MLGAADSVCQDGVPVAVDLIEAIKQLPLFSWGLRLLACGSNCPDHATVLFSPERFWALCIRDICVFVPKSCNRMV